MERVILMGKPNSGKTLLFNKLTGLTQKVANFPGVTVEIKSGHHGELEILDFPGSYSLNALTKDEEIAIDKFNQELSNANLNAVLCIIDVTRLEQSLMMGLQVQREAQAAGKDMVFVLTMMDELSSRGLSFDVDSLATELGAKVYAISAKTGYGLTPLKEYLDSGKSSVTFSKKEVVSRSDSDIRKLARQIGKRFLPTGGTLQTRNNLIDNIVLAPIIGGIIFTLVMAFLFQSIFTWAAPLMDGVEEIIGLVGQYTVGELDEGTFRDFLTDAVFGGLGSFLVFVPQIFILTFIIGILEDSGYMARAAVICHRGLKLFGLSGRSFVPLLSGHACSIPAIMAARSVESPRKRFLTILAIPLMSCSARLPVYSVLIAAMIPAESYFGGLIGLQGITFFGLYAFGMLTGLLVTGLLSKSNLSKEVDSPFMIELPPYRVPGLVPLARRAMHAGWHFITKAGLAIFTVTIVVWVLGYFPTGTGLENSFLGQFGQFFEFVFEPLGLDWKYGVAILASFVAREVFVGTLGTLFGIEGADEKMGDVASQIQESGISLGSGLALLAFYVIALQCVSTLVVIKKEMSNNLLPIGMFVGYGALAYLAAFFVKVLVG